MSEAAAVEALAPAETPVEAPSSEPDLSEIWKRNNEPEVVEALVEPDKDPTEAKEVPQEAVEAPQEPDKGGPEAKPAEDTPATVEAPSELPKAVREQWASMTPEAQEAVKASQQELNRKLSDQGRQIQAIGPIRDELVSMVQDMPEMANLTPDQVLGQIRKFRDDVLAPLNKDPLNTILKVAQERGVLQQLQEAMAGQQPSQNSQAFTQLVEQNKQLLNHIQSLEGRIGTVETAPVTQAVQDFVSGAEHWGEVEATIPDAIRYIKTVRPEASPQDVLKAAYDMEVQRLGKAPAPAPKAEAEVDPAHTEKVLKAKSVNVQSEPTSQKPLTEEQEYRKIWRKHQS